RVSGMAEPAQLLDWEGCQNARDVGGYPTADGRRVRSGALLRSDNLCRLTERGRGGRIVAGRARRVGRRCEPRRSPRRSGPARGQPCLRG
ncbi:MAG TPA: tyrosine-protein phosphatase, partial [Chloroflexota bacterium]|nr:tyrosine-protein phosphatase [Chloroflexota bacterium]